jgi:hypothetical protein
MPKTIDGWSIAATSTHEGTLTHAQRGKITFGDRNVGGSATTRIDLTHMAHGMDDGPAKAIPCFAAAADLIDGSLKAEGTATVHCGHGRSRTGFALIVFLMRYEGFTYKTALELVMAGMEDRKIPFDPNRKNAECDKGYQDWVLESADQIADKSTKVALRAGHVATEAKKNMHKVLLVVLQNKSVSPSKLHSEEDDSSRSRSGSLGSSGTSGSSSDDEDEPPSRQPSYHRGQFNMECTVQEGNAWLKQGGW